ncbi:MAG TPA: DUF4912 domain-containing protein [Methylomirabilota bacterium]|nr:DUF4912 domain-containing protein [Methylomirabilota bacterium]
MHAEDLAKQTRKALLALARQHGVTGVSRLRKHELLARLRDFLSRSVGEEEGMHAEDLARQTRKALLALARQHGVTGVSRLRKHELLARLRDFLTPRLETSLAPDHPSDAVGPSGVQISASSCAQAPLAPSPESVPVLPSKQKTEGVVSDPRVSSPALVSAPPPEQEAADSKFFLGPPQQTEVSEPDSLPASYNDNRIVLLARDPHWLYAYWDFSGAHLSQAQNRLTSGDSRLILRVFDVTYIEFNGANAWNNLDIELTPFATNWYIAVPHPDAAYCVEIGYHSRDGQFVSLGRSNVVTTPRAEPSPITTVRWFTPPERRAAAHLSAQPPRSSFAASEAAQQGPPFPSPAPSSAAHPFSWGVAPKP